MISSVYPEKLETHSRLSKVLIVDDHPIFRSGLREVLNQEAGVEIVGEAESEEEAFQAFVTMKPELVTVDVSLAAGNGLNLIARIKRECSATIVMVISMYDDSIYAELALAAGASAYVSKHTNASELRTALETVLQGNTYVSPALRQHSQLQTASPNGARSSKEKQLSSRELQIFTMIGQGRTTHDIADELHLAISTIETYRERLKVKLNLSLGSELTRHAIFWTVNTT